MGIGTATSISNEKGALGTLIPPPSPTHTYLQFSHLVSLCFLFNPSFRTQSPSPAISQWPSEFSGIAIYGDHVFPHTII